MQVWSWQGVGAVYNVVWRRSQNGAALDIHAGAMLTRIPRTHHEPGRSHRVSMRAREIPHAYAVRAAWRQGPCARSRKYGTPRAFTYRGSEWDNDATSRAHAC